MPSTINLTDATHKLEYFSFIIIGGIGLITNLLNILVSTKKEIKKTNMGFYNIILSIFNVFALLSRTLQIMPSIGQQDLLLTSQVACITIPYFARLSSQICLWINVLISFDRLFLMSYENFAAYKNRYIKDSKKQLKMITVIFFILSMVNIPGTFFHLETQKTFNNATNLTTVSIECTSTALIVVIRDSLSVIFRILLPLVIQVIISYILVYKLLRLEINVNSLSLKREYKFTFTIVILNVLFIFTDLLILIGLILINVYGYNQTYISTSSNQSAIASFFYLCSVVFALFNICDCLFFVNLVTNMKFRKEFKKIFLKIIKF